MTGMWKKWVHCLHVCPHNVPSATTWPVVRQAVKFMLLAQNYSKMMKYLASLNVDVFHNYNHGSFQQQPLIVPGVRGMLIPQQHLLPVAPPPPVALPPVALPS